MTVIPALLAEDVRRRGYAIWPGFASSTEIGTLQEHARILASGDHAHHYPKSTRVWDLYQFHTVFADMITKPGLGDVLDDLLGRYFLLSDYSLNVVNPGQPVDDWHIDYPYNEMRQITNGGVLGVQCILALDQFTESNGATRLVAGSHIPPRRPAAPWPLQTEAFIAEPGSLLIMAAATWHRSGHNASPTPRSAVLMSFIERWIKPLSAPLPTDLWVHDQRLKVMLGAQRPAETINGVPV